MAYCTALDMLDDFGDEEMAQLSAPEHPAVTGALLRLTAETGDRSAYSAEDIAAADAALDRINKRIIDAGFMMDSYLSVRQNLPLPQAVIDASNLNQTCRDIARYILNDKGAIEAVKERYLGWISWLKDLARGVATLGAGDTAVATGFGSMRVATGQSAHAWENY